MSWVYLALAIVLEVCGTTLMKMSQGFANIKYTIIMLFCYLLSLSMLTLALRKLEIGTAYAIWSGVGIVLITVIGFLFFKDSFDIRKVIFISFILIGAIGLNLTSNMH